MQNILLLNQTWFADELRAYGYNVATLGGSYKFDFQVPAPLPPIKTLLSFVSSKFKPDLIIYHDDSAQATCTGFGELDIPSIFYSVDTHHHCQWHSYFARGFDLVVVAQKDFLSKVAVQNENAHWLPLWCSVDYNYPGLRDIDVSFRGTLDKKLNPERVQFFDELKKLVNVDASMGQFVDVYPRSKIVLNQAVRTDLNFRIFEALGSGALLLTPRLTNGFEDLFEDKVNLAVYETNSAKSAAEQISFYLENQSLRNEIAASGYELARKEHTAFNRVASLRQKMNFGRVKSGYYFGDAFISTIIAKSSSLKLTKFIDVMLSKALQNFISAIEVGESMDEAVGVAAVITAEMLTERGRSSEANQLLLMLAEAYPEREVFSLCSIVSMKSCGFTEEQVLSFAKTKFDNAQLATERAGKIVATFKDGISLGS